MSGIFYGAGVGPGDPELLTVKALRVMKQCPVIAIPVSDKNFTEAAYDPTGTDPAYKRYLEKCVAYQIAVQAGADIGQKAKLYLPMPMMKEKEQLRQVHDEGAEKTAELLEKGMDVVFITLGDPTVYSTCMYIHKRIRKQGYETRIIPGVPSFCAAAARLDQSLVENQEELHIIPASYEIEEGLKMAGTKVLMKAGRKIPYVKQVIKEQNLNLTMVENCGMENETIYHELGHFLAFVAGNVDRTSDFAAVYNSEKSKFTGINRSYATQNSSEYFAESVLEYVTSPSTLKRQRPKTYAAIVAALNKITDERIQRVMDIYGPFWS